MMREKGLRGGNDGGDSPVGGLMTGRYPAAADYYPFSWPSSHPPAAPPHLDLDALEAHHRMLPSVPSLGKSPFNTPPLPGPHMLSPHASSTFSSAGLEDGAPTDGAAYKRSALSAAAYRGAPHFIYGGQQAPPPPPPSPFSMSAAVYPGAKDSSSGYLGLSGVVDSSERSALYGRSVLEKSLFNRMASLPCSAGSSSGVGGNSLVSSYRGQLGSAGEELGVDGGLEKKFGFGSNHCPSPLLSTAAAPPYSRLLDSYAQPADRLTAAGKGTGQCRDSGGGGGERGFPSSGGALQPRHAAFSTGPSFIGRSPALYPSFAHLGSGFPPESYASYASSLTHLSNYGQLSSAAPPPAHSQGHDVAGQRSGSAEEDIQIRREASVAQAFDATLSSNFTLTTSLWNDSRAGASKPDHSLAPFDEQSHGSNARSQRPLSCYPDSPTLPLDKEEEEEEEDEGLEQLMGSQFVAVGSQEKRVSLPPQPCPPPPISSPCQTGSSWGGTHTSGAAASSHSISSLSVHDDDACVSTGSDRRVERTTTMMRGGNPSHHTASPFPPCRQSPPAFPATGGRFAATTSTVHSSFTVSRSSDSSHQCSSQASLCYSPMEGERDLDQGEGRRAQAASVCTDNGVTDMAYSRPLQSEPFFSYTISEESSAKAFSGSAVSNSREHVLSDYYDNSTSEYEPPTPNQESVDCKMEMPELDDILLKPSFLSALERSSGSVHVDTPFSKTRLRVSAERITVQPGERVLVGHSVITSGAQKKRRRKTGGQGESGKRISKTCPFCLKAFARADTLTCHLRVHTGDRPYRCGQCPSSYKVSSHLKDHIRSKHSDTKQFQCGRCHKAFTYSTARRRHEKICGRDLADRVEFQCDVCLKEFVTEKGFSKHREKCGSDRLKGERSTHKCKKCRKVFDSKASLDGHQQFFCGKTTVQTNRYSCNECGKAFFKRDPFIVHIRRHAGRKPFRCLQCEECIVDKDSLKRHVAEHGADTKFSCSSCDASFFLKQCLSVHVRRVHGGVKNYKCKDCAWEFSSGYHRCRHVRTAHRRVKQFGYVLVGSAFCAASFGGRRTHRRFQSKRAPPGQSIGRISCQLCSKSFSLEELRAHVSAEHAGVLLSEALSKQLSRCQLCCKDFSCQQTRRVHMLRHKGKKPFSCPQCKLPFLLRSVLRSHQVRRAHSQPHSCRQCEKSFRWHTSLRQHLSTHQGHQSDGGSKGGGGKFKCNVCGKGFREQIFLNMHMQSHRTAVPNVCSLCGKGFVDLRYLKQHMRKHQAKTFVCEKCGKAFTSSLRLQNHLKKKHTEQPELPKKQKQEWLCEECGKSMSRRDSLLKHMALHVKYQTSDVPKRGPRKGSHPTKRKTWSEQQQDATQNSHDSGPQQQSNFPSPVSGNVYGSNPTDQKPWGKQTGAMQNSHASTLLRKADFSPPVPGNRYESPEPDLVELKPVSFLPAPSVGPSPTLGMAPDNYGASRYGPVSQGFAAPFPPHPHPSFASPLPSPQQQQYDYHPHQYYHYHPHHEYDPSMKNHSLHSPAVVNH